MLDLEMGKMNYYTIKFNNKYIHSKYNPIKESEIFIDKYSKLLKNKTIVVYGLGLGYHIENILTRVDKDTKIIVFEWSRKIIQLCKSVNPGLFRKNNIKIFTEDDNFYLFLGQYLKTVDDIIIYKPCLEVIEEVNYDLYTIINNYSINKLSIEKNRKLLIENYNNNIKLDVNNIKNLIEKYKNIEKPYIVVSAGPSLDNDIKVLKKYRKNYIIISVGSALMTLMNGDIVPDIITIIDGKKQVSNQFNGFNLNDVPMCFLSTASRWAVNNYKGPKYIFFNDSTEGDLVIETGKTVAVACINIALKCGAKKVIFLGQDLAYINGKTHSYTYENMYKQKDMINVSARTQTVKGVKGNILYTSKAYLYYKQQIEKIINTYKDIRFINCSKGAFINGAVHMELKDCIKVK